MQSEAEGAAPMRKGGSPYPHPPCQSTFHACVSRFRVL